MKNMFSDISSIIFVICRSEKKNAHDEVHEKMLRQTFSMFEPEQCLNMRNYKYSFNRNVTIFWQMELVLFFCFLCFVLVHSVYSKFWLCDYC